jgi:hypothetical protein
MRYYFRFFILCVAVLVCCMCSKRETDLFPDQSYQTQYMPLNIGQVLEYQLDSILFDFDTLNMRRLDTISLHIREEVIDTFSSAAGTEYKIVRSERQPNGAWLPVHTFTAGKDTQKAWRSENHFRLLKMPFPMTLRSRWNGLTWIDTDTELEIRGQLMRPFTSWEFEVDSIDIPRTYGALSFDSTLQITEADNTNAIEKRFSRVVYALHIGVVYKEQWILDSQYCNQNPPPTDCETLPWEQKGERGYILKQVITKY